MQCISYRVHLIRYGSTHLARTLVRKSECSFSILF